MAFHVDHETGEIKMHSGDTGAFIQPLTRGSGAEFGADDIAVFTVISDQGEILIERIFHLDDDEGLGNGKILIEFHNADTDGWDFGTYFWEVRVLIHPYYDSEGHPVDGDVVRTPENRTRVPLTIEPVQKRI